MTKAKAKVEVMASVREEEVWMVDRHSYSHLHLHPLRAGAGAVSKLVGAWPAPSTHHLPHQPKGRDRREAEVPPNQL